MEYIFIKPKGVTGFTKPGWYYFISDNEVIGPYSLVEAMEIEKNFEFSASNLTKTEKSV